MPVKLRLTRFYAERGYVEPAPTEEGTSDSTTGDQTTGMPVRARFEFVLGLSQPLPGLFDASGRVRDELLQLKLFTDDELLVEAPNLALDQAASSDTILVYRLELLRSHPGSWYNAALVLDPAFAASLPETNFTFSIASPRPNVQLVAKLVQSPPEADIDPPPTNRGTVRTSEGPGRIEVQVLGGSPITGATILGFLQKIDAGVEPIFASGLPFLDNGRGGDRTADDGIYTMLIPIDRLAQPGEYRVGLLGLSTPESRNIRIEDPSMFDEKRKKENEARKASTSRRTTRSVTRSSAGSSSDSDTKEPVNTEPQPALQFQRATTLHFRVER